MQRDKAMLKTFLVHNPEIDLDKVDPEGKLNIKKRENIDNLLVLVGIAVLYEACTQTTQFAEILLEAEVGMLDSLGNPPLQQTTGKLQVY